MNLIGSSFLEIFGPATTDSNKPDDVGVGVCVLTIVGVQVLVAVTFGVGVLVVISEGSDTKTLGTTIPPTIVGVLVAVLVGV